MNTIVQIVQGRLSRKKLAKYSVINMEWLCNKNKFAGRGISRRGNSHCKQYIVQYWRPREHLRGFFECQNPVRTRQKTKRVRPTLEILSSYPGFTGKEASYACDDYVTLKGK